MNDPGPTDRTADLSQWSERLREASFMRGLEDDERSALLRRMVSEEFDVGEVIFRQETITRNLWLLLEGTCEVIKEPPIGSYGSPVSLAHLSSLDVFGEMTLISARPHTATVEAKTKVRTLRLRSADFEELIDSQPRLACTLACNLVCILSERLRSVDDKLGRCLDDHDTKEIQETWKELRARLGKLYAGSPL